MNRATVQAGGILLPNLSQAINRIPQLAPLIALYLYRDEHFSIDINQKKSSSISRNQVVRLAGLQISQSEKDGFFRHGLTAVFCSTVKIGPF